MNVPLAHMTPAGTPNAQRKPRDGSGGGPYAVLHVSDFSLQAVLRLEPDLADRPVALLDDTRRPPVVVACTPVAEAAGVRVGFTPPQAMARCAGIVLRTRRPEAETEARAGLLAVAFAVGPEVEDTAPGVCTIRVAGVAANRREPALQAAVTRLQQLGLGATAGLASTPLLALYAARYGGGSGGSGAGWAVGEPPPIRRTAGDDPGTPGLGGDSGVAAVTCVTGAEDARAFLSDLPLAVAEPSPELAAILAGWGLRTLGQLTALPKPDVTERLGPAGLALWERAAGEVTRPLHTVSPPPTFTAAMELEQAVETLEPLLFVLRRFVDRLALELRNAGSVAGEMRLELQLADESAHTHEFRLPEPTAREEVLFRVLHTHLETLHTAAPVQGLRFSCRPVRPWTRQQGLFESALRDPHGFVETLARVGTVVGPDRVGTPALENTHRPDAVRLQPPLAVVPPPAKQPEQPPCGPPLRRHRPPLPAKVELQEQTPVFVWTPAQAGAVRAAAGPWRGSGEWWDAARAWRREEWDVELETGGLYRLLHTPEGWFVEGEYD